MERQQQQQQHSGLTESKQKVAKKIKSHFYVKNRPTHLINVV